MDPETVTTLLDRLRSGDDSASGRLYEMVQAELHSRARKLMGAAGPHTLQPTALVHEAWMRIERSGSSAGDREHFLAVASRAMRSVLIDHARAKQAAKRDGGERVLLDDALDVFAERVPDVLELNDELERLAEADPRSARVVELRFFGGLSIEDAASVLGVGHATVERDWRFARAWLSSRLTGEGDGA